MRRISSCAFILYICPLACPGVATGQANEPP